MVSVPFRGFRGLQAQFISTWSGRKTSLFQSPSGVLGVCRAMETWGGSDSINAVSVPFRGFRGLQGATVTSRSWRSARPFQSPSGVLGVCREIFVEHIDDLDQSFSPLPGF